MPRRRPLPVFESHREAVAAVGEGGLYWVRIRGPGEEHQMLHGPGGNYNAFIWCCGRTWSWTLTGSTGLHGHYRRPETARAAVERELYRRVVAAYEAWNAATAP